MAQDVGLWQNQLADKFNDYLFDFIRFSLANSICDLFDLSVFAHCRHSKLNSLDDVVLTELVSLAGDVFAEGSRYFFLVPFLFHFLGQFRFI